jgi:hypothetical protein
VNRIVVVNLCVDLVDHATAQKWVNAWQRQVSCDFAPVWGKAAILHYAGDGASERPAPSDWVLRLVHISGLDGSLGSHWVADGRPVGEVGVQTCLDEGVEPPQCGSHEVLELVEDAPATRYFQAGKMMLADEVCDRIESSDSDYRIDGVLVENFSLPSAFVPDSGGPYDFRRRAPSNEILPSGYQQQVDISTGSWTQITGPLARKSKHVAGSGSRRAARMQRAGLPPQMLALVNS